MTTKIPIADEDLTAYLEAALTPPAGSVRRTCRNCRLDRLERTLAQIS